MASDSPTPVAAKPPKAPVNTSRLTGASKGDQLKSKKPITITGQQMLSLGFPETDRGQSLDALFDASKMPCDKCRTSGIVCKIPALGPFSETKHDAPLPVMPRYVRRSCQQCSIFKHGCSHATNKRSAVSWLEELPNKQGKRMENTTGTSKQNNPLRVKWVRAGPGAQSEKPSNVVTQVVLGGEHTSSDVPDIPSDPSPPRAFRGSEAADDSRSNGYLDNPSQALGDQPVEYKDTHAFVQGWREGLATSLTGPHGDSHQAANKADHGPRTSSKRQATSPSHKASRLDQIEISGDVSKRSRTRARRNRARAEVAEPLAAATELSPSTADSPSQDGIERPKNDAQPSGHPVPLYSMPTQLRSEDRSNPEPPHLHSTLDILLEELQAHELSITVQEEQACGTHATNSESVPDIPIPDLFEADFPLDWIYFQYSSHSDTQMTRPKLDTDDETLSRSPGSRSPGENIAESMSASTSAKVVAESPKSGRQKIYIDNEWRPISDLGTPVETDYKHARLIAVFTSKWSKNTGSETDSS